MAHAPNKADKFHQGRYKVKNISKYMGNPSDIIYRSSWEYKFMIYCDLNVNVLKWGSENFKIPYKDYKGHNRIYIPDFYLETRGEIEGFVNKFLVEIKPEKETKEPIIPVGNISEKKLKNLQYELGVWQKNKYKWVHAVEWCKQKDITFWIVTESNLGLFKI